MHKSLKFWKISEEVRNMILVSISTGPYQICSYNFK